MKKIERFQIQFDDRDILQLLSGNKERSKNKKPKQKLLDEIAEMKQLAQTLIHPQAIYDHYESKSLKPRFLFTKAEYTVFAICTIGRDLELESEKAIEKGQLSKGVILDAIASSVTEDIANQFYQIIVTDNDFNSSNLSYTQKFSPGYCQWTLEEGQDLIFSKLSADSIEVSLSPSKMMIPRKSISFAINFGVEVDKMLGLRDCDTCDMKNCSHRR